MNEVRHTTLDLALRLIRTHPYLALISVLALTLGGLADGISIAMLLPLMNQFIGDAETDNTIVRAAHQIFHVFNITPGVGPFLVLIVLSVTISAIFSLAAKLQIGYVSAKYGAELRDSIIASAVNARWQHFVELASGRLAAAIGTEAQQAGGSYVALSKIFAATIQFVIQIVIVFLISWQIGLGAIIFGILLLFMASRLVTYSRVMAVQRRDGLEALMSRILEGLSAMKSLKGMGAEGRIVPLLRWEVDRIKKASRNIVALSELILTFPKPLIALCVAIGLYLFVVLKGGAFDSFLILSILFVRSVTSLNQLQLGYQRFISIEPSYLFVQDVISKANTDKEVLTGTIDCRFTRSLEIKNISFSYDGKSVLQNAEATIKAGEFIAIVGRSGEGKTTLIDLVTGLLKPDAGAVIVDGISLNDIDMPKWRSRIGYVLQDTFLFHATVLENITFGDPDIGEKKVVEALRAADAWDIVTAMPDGLHTVVGERGSRLSGGQRQRFAIARALVRQPDLLILDEPTSALDQESEEKLCRTLSKLVGQITVLVVSHQPALMTVADRVFRVEGGSLSEDWASVPAADPERLFQEKPLLSN